MREIKTISAKKYQKGNKYPDVDIYEFPFQVLDKRSGGSNLGRIEWHVEPIKGRKTKNRYYIEKLLIWTTQTKDERYKGKIFEIPCYSESITGDSINRESYLNYVWRTMYCEVHKGIVFSAYPANHHGVLKINVGSSISIGMDFH